MGKKGPNLCKTSYRFEINLLGFSFARSISKFLWWISLGVAVLLLVFSL
ncbi:hypothetical protein V6Z12_D08G172100 [Gossypium hirsutum]